MTWEIRFDERNFNYGSYLYFLGQLEHARHRNERRLRLDLSRQGFFYPDGVAPLVATIRYLYDEGWDVDVVPPADDLFDYWEKAGWRPAIEGRQPRARLRGSNYLPLMPFSDGETLNGLVNQAHDILAEGDVFPRGVIEAVDWSMNEVAGNVLDHSQTAQPGWLQLIRFPDRRQVEFVIVDTGRGVLRSLNERYAQLRSETEALELAVQKGVTGSSSGQGNGLAGLFNIAVQAGGWLNLHSGTGQLRVRGGTLSVSGSHQHHGMLATVTLPTDSEIDLKHALWGHVPTPAFEDRYLDDAGIQFVLRDEATGFGNRPTATLIRNRLENLMVEYPDEAVIVDFSGIEVIAASFADELIAKLVEELGATRFFGRFRLRGLSEFAATTIDQVIKQRLGQQTT